MCTVQERRKKTQLNKSKDLEPTLSLAISFGVETMEMENRSGYEENLNHPNPVEQQFKTMRSEGSEDLPIYKYPEFYTSPPERKILWTELLAVFAVSVGMLVGGFSIDYTNSSTPSLVDSTLNNDNFLTIFLVGDTMPLQVAVGAFLAAPLLTYAGRKYSLMGVGVTFFIGWSILATASNTYLYISGQFLCAISTGVLYSVFPVYIVETVRPELRGALGLLPTAFKNGGATLSYFTGARWDWSKMACLATSLSVIFFLLMLLTPESPRWYISKSQPDKARKSLQQLRGQNYNIENEMQDLTRSQIVGNKSIVNAFRQMFYMENIPTVLISIALMLFQQLSGSNILIYYSQDISEKSSGIDITLFGVILGISSIVANLFSIILIDRIGRKILLCISSGSMIISSVSLAAFAYAHESRISVGLLPKACVILQIFGFSLGYGSIPWLILGEILPVKIRGTAASLIIGVNWIFSFYISIMFPNILQSVTLYEAMALFIAINLIEVLFVTFCVPETCGKSLEEIELNLTQRVKNVNGNAGANPDTNADVNGDA